MITADEAIATIAYLIPGFVALKVFQVVALRTRRTDLELTLWSLLASAAIRAVVVPLGITSPTLDLAVSLVLAVVAALVASRLWAGATRRWPRLSHAVSRQAWDAMFAVPGWAQVWTDDGRIVFGWPHLVAETAETDTPDLLIAEPAWVDPDTQARTPMTGVEFVLLPERSIRMVQYTRDTRGKRGASG